MADSTSDTDYDSEEIVSEVAQEQAASEVELSDSGDDDHLDDHREHPQVNPGESCPWPIHCAGCPALPTSTFLIPNELNAHGCCGRADLCKAHPPLPHVDHLYILLDDASDLEGNNHSKRKFVFKRWFHTSKQAGTQSTNWDHTGAIPRVRFSCCVHRRVRVTFPSHTYLGFLSD